MPRYIHENAKWPELTWDTDELLPLLMSIRHKQGRLKAHLHLLGFAMRNETDLQTLTQDVLKSNEIEGEFLDAQQVRSSIARQLGMHIAGLIPSDRNVDGLVEMMLDATRNYKVPLTKNRLYGWHSLLFPEGRSGMHKITVGKWRRNDKGPMQVVSGAMGKERVHYEAPDATRVRHEMKLFLKWFNTDKKTDPVLKSGVAHFRFVTIHPFDDGNGRMARAIADMQLSRADGEAQRYYSMSAQIRVERKNYYEMLEKTQKGNTDITKWLLWYLTCLDRALNKTDQRLNVVLRKAEFWDTHTRTSINERQRAMINKLFDGFEGKLTSTKWGKITKCSADTALRDIQDLMKKKILKKENAGGRSTSYGLRENRSD
ncbi:MAG: Fic family protein [Bacteroidetes bacterium]|nr:Fic family protein [Bacteroidota bacterium]